jgi:fatty acid desaturase
MSEGRTQGWLRFRADRRTIGFAVLWFALVAVQWVAIPYTWIDLLPAPFGRAAAWTWWTWPKAVGAAALLALTCLLSFVGAVSSHNVMHCPMFRRPWMNDAWRFVQSLWCGQPVSVFVPVHNHGHHKYAQSRKDLTRSTKFDTGWQLTNLVRATQWRNAALRDCIRYFDALRVRGGRRWKEPLVEAAVLLSAYAVLAVVDGRR